jgi:Lon protease-like protein
MDAGLLPLFPLPLVLFPRTPAPLHIFEERYKEMVGEAIGNGSEFGIVLAGEEGVANTGCTAVVDHVVERYADGRMDIIAAGRRRFEIQRLDHGRAFLRAAVDYFDDNDDAEPPEELRRQVLAAYAEIMRLASNSPLLDPDLTGSQLSFQLAHVLTDPNARQLLLVSRSEVDRMRQLKELFPKVLRERQESSRVQRSASTNGHGRRPVGL